VEIVDQELLEGGREVASAEDEKWSRSGFS